MRSVRRAVAAVAVCAALILGIAACGNDSSSTTTPTVPRTTDTFSGTVAVGGSAFNSFRVGATGTTEVTLIAAGPPSSIVVGLSIGTVSDSGCTPVAGASVNTAAGSTAQLAGVTSSGTLCVQLRDIGNQTTPITYSVSVLHP